MQNTPDYAEYLTFYSITQLRGDDYRIEVWQDDICVYSYAPFDNPAVPDRYEDLGPELRSELK